MRESQFIDWIRAQSRFDPKIVEVGPGDDCAVVLVGAERLVVTTDQTLDGVHFVLADHGPEAGGRKAMARGLSDIAAMASAPLGAVAAVAFGPNMSPSQAESIYRGLRSVADEFGCPVVGGDVGVWDGPLAITVTVFGRPDGIDPVLRSGARVGDSICVTGALGGAWRTDRHLSFRPRIAEARALAREYDLHAMIDVSDGLATDLGHMCGASGVGAEVWAKDIPVHPAAAAGDEEAGLGAALGDGEDYELLFAVPVEGAELLLEDQPLPVGVSRIGRITESAGLAMIGLDGRRRPLEPTGWEHGT